MMKLQAMRMAQPPSLFIKLELPVALVTILSAHHETEARLVSVREV